MVIRKGLIFGSMVALGIALLPMPYAYYMLLRIGICSVFAYLAFNAWEASDQNFTWVLGITAAIYNPFVPIYLGREIWIVINLGTIGLLWLVKKRAAKSP